MIDLAHCAHCAAFVAELISATDCVNCITGPSGKTQLATQSPGLDLSMQLGVCSGREY